jgi:hypothetical protein
MPTAKEILDQIGSDFVAAIRKNRRDAWRKVVDTVMLNLTTLIEAHYVQPLRDIIAILMEVDQKILGGSQQGATSEPLDVMALKWTHNDESEIKEDR